MKSEDQYIEDILDNLEGVSIVELHMILEGIFDNTEVIKMMNRFKERLVNGD